MALGQLALAAPHLVAEVLALRGEELVPALAADRQRGAGLGEQDGGARCASLQPSAPPRRSPTSRSARQRRSASSGRSARGDAVAVGRGAHGAELVGGPVADEAQHAQRPRAVEVEREQRRRSSPRDPGPRAAGARARRRSGRHHTAPSPGWRRRSRRPRPAGSSPRRRRRSRRAARTSARPWLLYGRLGSGRHYRQVRSATRRRPRDEGRPRSLLPRGQRAAGRPSSR